jgi:ATP-dependent protease Clp ATPase subunit
MKVTEYEINTTSNCNKGIHIMGPDGTHCKECRINVLDYLEEISKISEKNRHSRCVTPEKRKGTLDDFVIK